MYHFNGKANRAVRRLAEQKLKQQLNTITIFHRKEGDSDVYQWGANTGEWFSPVIYSMEEAFQYPVTVGLKLQTAG